MLFEHKEILWLLCIIPLIVVAFFLKRRHKQQMMLKFASKSMLSRLQPDASHRRPVIKLILLCLGIGMLIISLANPRVGSTLSEGEQRGIDMAVCIDVSNSMLAQDLKPSRMARCKQVVQNLISQLGGDRISLVVFAGRAYIEMPLTNDYGATKMFLDQIGTDLINEQGTAIGDAIEKGMATLGYSEKEGDNEPQWEPNKSRAIIVISDGENHEDDAIQSAKDAAEQGIMVCTIGVGSPSGSQIPITDRNGKVVDWRRDSEGNIVTTHLNEEMLRDIAKAGNGIYTHAGNGNAAVGEIIKEISKLDSQKFGAAKFSSYKSQYQYPLIAGLLCLLLELFIFERRNSKYSFNRIIKRKSLILILLAMQVPALQAQAPDAGENKGYNYQQEKTTIPYKVKHSIAKQRRVETRKGYKALKKENNNDAVKSLRKALQSDSNYSKAQYNVAIAHGKLNQQDSALAYYKRVCQNSSSTSQTRAKAHYNAGNIHLKRALSARDTGGYDGQSLRAAIEEYKASLRLDSKNHDAQHNISLAKQLLRPETQQGGGGGNQNQNQNKNQNDQNQNQDQNKNQNQQQQNQQQQQQQNQQQSQAGEQGKQQQEQRRREAEQMLNAMKNNEQQTMKAIRMREADKERRKGNPTKIEKDW